MKKLVLIAVIFGVILVISACSDNEKEPPVAAKFNNYVGRLADYNKGYIDIENKLHAAAGKSVNEKTILFDNASNELKTINAQIEETDAPLELNGLKKLFVTRNEALIEQFQLEKKNLLAGGESPEAGEEEEIISAKILTTDGRIEALVKSVEEVNHVKCLNSSAVIQLVKLKGNKYFIDVK